MKTPNGHGNCQNEINGKALCYVTQPSSCTDLKSSIAFPGEKYSYEACDEPRKWILSMVAGHVILLNGTNRDISIIHT